MSGPGKNTLEQLCNVLREIDALERLANAARDLYRRICDHSVMELFPDEVAEFEDALESWMRLQAANCEEPSEAAREVEPDEVEMRLDTET